ncbi:MAG: hypothetical protein ABI045_01545 [Flavobacteriales bacterium]
MCWYFIFIQALVNIGGCLLEGLPKARPEFSKGSWFAILFTAIIQISLLFFLV